MVFIGIYSLAQNENIMSLAGKYPHSDENIMSLAKKKSTFNSCFPGKIILGIKKL